MSDSFWVVMRAHEWSSITVGGYPLSAPTGGPCRFLPVFSTRAEAIAFAGTPEHVAELKAITAPNSQPEPEFRSGKRKTSRE